MAYDFIHRNMPEALPSLRTVQRVAASQHPPIREGDFRYDELVEHLRSHEAPMVVSIGEDATRLISRVEYDSTTDCLVGFVLPVDEHGMPQCDKYAASSFEKIEEAFETGVKSKLAFVYMAQPVREDVPAFCLSCQGTDNKFTAELVQQRWKTIYSECKVRGIRVLSYGADGDSRELRAMQLSTQLSCTSLQSASSNSMSFNKIRIPIEWNTWFAAKNATNLAYIQDMVHIAVKLKTRLLKPSVVLPLGKYLAGAYHLRLLQSTYGKDQHGLRERDLNAKDKQNFEAVVRITSQSVQKLLEKFPDAKGTLAYLRVIELVMDSFLDKNLDACERVKKAWHAVFFLRYWRHWILLSPKYALGKNFITTNAYMCIELNAHCLISLIITCRDTLPEEDCFRPWLLGSQCCEKLFRSARSMTSTFSTVINFSILGLLRRLHRLQTLHNLEGESEATGIKYPRVELHRKKDGKNKANRTKLRCDEVSNDDILKAVMEGKKEAQDTLEALGMRKLLKDSKCWDNPPIPTSYEPEDTVDDEDDDDDGNDDEATGSEYTSLIETIDENQIQDLTKAKIIDDGLSANLKKSVFHRTENSALPLYDVAKEESSSKKRKYCSYVEITHNGNQHYLHKSTAVWLLQEGERVSSDRLFRVRKQQPYITHSLNYVTSKSSRKHQ